MVNISNVVESVSNPEGRFATLRGIFPVTDDGKLILRSGSGYCDIEIMYGDRRANLRCFLQKENSRAERLAGISRFLTAIDEPVYGLFTFLENELLVFHDNGLCQYIDVAVWAIPSGQLVSEYALGCLRDGDTGRLEALLSRLADFSARHIGHKLDMGGIDPCSLNVDISGKIVLSGFIEAKRCENVRDIHGLALLFCRLYLGYSDERIPALSGPDFNEIMEKLAGGNLLPEPIQKIYGWVLAPGESDPVIEAMHDAVLVGLERASDITSFLNDVGIVCGETTVTGKLKFEFVGEMSCMLMRAFDGEKWCYLDKNGDVAIPGPYLDASDFWEGIATVEVETERMGVIDTEGNVVIPAIYDDLEFDLTGNRLIVTIDGQSGLMTRSGEMLTGLDYDHIATQSEGIYMVWKNGKMGFITRDGRKVTDIIYESGDSFSAGRAKVTLHGRRYVIGSEGEVIDEIIEAS